MCRPTLGVAPSCGGNTRYAVRLSTPSLSATATVQFTAYCGVGGKAALTKGRRMRGCVGCEADDGAAVLGRQGRPLNLVFVNVDTILCVDVGVVLRQPGDGDSACAAENATAKITARMAVQDRVRCCARTHEYLRDCCCESHATILWNFDLKTQVSGVCVHPGVTGLRCA
jgi:hypothetical protein